MLETAEFVKVRFVNGQAWVLCAPTSPATLALYPPVYMDWRPGANPGEGWKVLTYLFPRRHGMGDW